MMNEALEPGVRRMTPQEMDELLNGKTSHVVELHPLGGELWRVKDLDLATTDGGEALMRAFIESHYHDDFTLSIFNDLTQRTVEIGCTLLDMPGIVSAIYHLEHATPLSFIGENLITDSYVVGMTLSRGRIVSGRYAIEDGRLIRM